MAREAQSSPGAVKSIWEWLRRTPLNGVAVLTALAPVGFIVWDWYHLDGHLNLLQAADDWRLGYLIGLGPEAAHTKLVIAAVVLVIGAGVIAHLTLEKREREAITGELLFYFFSSPTPLLVGGAVSLILLTPFLAFPHNGPLSQVGVPSVDYPARYEAAWSLYLTTMGVVVALYTLFRRNSPIVDWNQLIRVLHSDLTDAKDNGAVIWMVYPALNLAYFRNAFTVERRNGSLKKIKNKDGLDFWRETFQDPLEQVIKSDKCSFNAIVYPDKYLDELFTTYSRGHDTDGLDEAATDEIQRELLQEALRLHRLAALTDENNTGFARNSTLRYKGPTGFPPHVILVGDVVYSITTYGMPIFRTVGDREWFQWPGGPPEMAAENAQPQPGEEHKEDASLGKGKKVRLLAYRRRDPVIAEHVRMELEVLFAGCQELSPDGEPKTRTRTDPKPPARRRGSKRKASQKRV